MNNIDKTNRLLLSLTSIYSRETTDLIYSSNSISYDKCNLYSDFIQSLITIVFDTYMGDDITKESDKLRHFQWVWYTNLDNFNKEGIKFNDTLELYDYFLIYLFESFYNIPTKDKLLYDTILMVWLKLFDMNILKTKSDMDLFLDIYKVFETSLIKK